LRTRWELTAGFRGRRAPKKGLGKARQRSGGEAKEGKMK